MFEEVSDVELVDFMGEETREESAAMGRRLAAVAELFVRRRQQYDEARFVFTDVHAAVAAEISPIQNISHARALSQVHMARMLRERLPRIAAVFRTGAIDYRMVATLINRTENVDDDVIVDLDDALARYAHKWMKLSGPKLRDRVDLWVAKYDPAAVRVPPKADEQRYVETQPVPNAPGLAFLSGVIRAEYAAAVDVRLDALAATVCEHDPRTRTQRRADACGPLAREEATLACQCGRQDCPAVGQRNAAAAAVVHVLAEQATLDGSSNTPGYLPGFGILPAESVRDLAATATLKPVTLPSTADAPTAQNPAAQTSAGYRPAAALTEFLRWRDLTCLWPGCDKPAAKSDIDHTTPWPYGPTHPSSLKHYCRTHHLIKTFLAGVGGWTDRQLPDGTIVLTAPTGHVYESTPHGAALFPILATPTGEVASSSPPAVSAAELLAKMPRRRQTREQDRRDRINAERRERTELIAEEERQRQAWLAANYEPPPF